MPGVYLWVIDGVGVYVGESRSLRLRNETIGRYQGRKMQKCARLLREALAKGKTVKIYVIEDPRLKWSGMTLPLRRAVEHALLLDWVPAWNTRDQGITAGEEQP